MNFKVLITGCSTGIGRALAVEFSKRSHTVIATARKVETLKELAECGMITLPLDVTNLESIESAVKESVARAGGIDILVNNAGFGLMGPMMELRLDDLRRQYETNVIGPVAMARAVFPVMVKQKSGRIVNISSVSGIMATPFAGAYCSSKAALNSLSDAMRLEMEPLGIKVVTVQPGAIESKFGDTAADSLAGVLGKESIYSIMIPFMEKRAKESQQGATPAEEFAAEVVAKVTSANPPAVMRVGKNSTLMPILKTILPPAVLDKILAKRFGLEILRRN